MQRIVLDTNVIISALLFGGLPEIVLIGVLSGKYQCVLSPYIIEETGRILKTKFGISSELIVPFQQFLGIAENFYFEPFMSILEDDPDNRILETAIKGRADYIITGDKQLLALSRYEEIQIVNPSGFMDISHR